jgi:Mrp family chromosome partitioning ATPase
MEEIEKFMTQELASIKPRVDARQLSVMPPAYSRRVMFPYSLLPQQEEKKVRLIEELCRSFCLSLFFRQREPVRSLGITSSVAGEGKSFVATMLAHVLANDSPLPVLLVECDWENTSQHDYFGFPPTPGLAEWLRGECRESDIRYRIGENLTIIRAGNGRQDAVWMLQQIARRGFVGTLARNNENLIIDLPSIITTSYGLFAAGMVEALALVVRSGVTPDRLVADACTFLKPLPLQGIILNQVPYHPENRSIVRRTL